MARDRKRANGARFIAGRRQGVAGCKVASKKASKDIGLSIRVAMAVAFAFSASGRKLVKWLEVDSVVQTRRLWLSHEKEAARLLMKNLLNDANFHRCAQQALRDGIRCDFVKSPNYLLSSCGLPKALPPDLELCRENNCTPNSWKFILQEVLMQGYFGLFRFLTENLSPGSNLDKMASFLLATKGAVSLQSETAKTAEILDSKKEVMQEYDLNGTPNFKTWDHDHYRVWTLHGQWEWCADCKTRTNTQTRPNLTREQFMQLVGAVETKPLRRFCGQCRKWTLHRVEYVLGPHGLYIDCMGGQEGSHDIRELLEPFKDKVELNGQTLSLICCPVAEFTEVEGHQFVIKRLPDGSIRQINDSKAKVWDSPFPSKPGRPHPKLLRLSGVLYGSTTAPPSFC